jgi:RNA recognition motif-containing protein
MIIKRYESIKDSSLPPNLTFRHSFLAQSDKTSLFVPPLNEEASRSKVEPKIFSANKIDYKKLFIRNIPRSKTEDEIKKYFKLYLTKINPISMNRIKTDGEMSTWLVHFKQRIGKNWKKCFCHVSMKPFNFL